MRNDKMNLAALRLRLEDTRKLLVSAMTSIDENSDADYQIGVGFDRIDEAVERIQDIIKEIELELK
jgi:hypothetical protein